MYLSTCIYKRNRSTSFYRCIIYENVDKCLPSTCIAARLMFCCNVLFFFTPSITAYSYSYHFCSVGSFSVVFRRLKNYSNPYFQWLRDRFPTRNPYVYYTCNRLLGLDKLMIFEFELSWVNFCLFFAFNSLLCLLCAVIIQLCFQCNETISFFEKIFFLLLINNERNSNRLYWVDRRCNIYIYLYTYQTEKNTCIQNLRTK